MSSMKEDVFSLPQKDPIIVRWPANLDQDDLEDMEQFFRLIVGKLGRELGVLLDYNI